jgi:glutamate racemase
VATRLKNASPDQPIGIFDSGIGGLTVANAIKEKLPKERIIYFGDTAHLPYGDKSPDSIKYYSIRIAQFLLQKNCKMIVIACNTASSMGYEIVKEFVGNQARVVNVIDPVVKKIVSDRATRKVGVIGTKGTIKSNIYAKKIKELKSNLEVASLATPLLASMIEEGFFNNKISRTIIHSYLSSKKLRKIDTLILACTHYPLIKPEIQDFYKGDVKVIDSAGVVAEHVAALLKKDGLLNNKKNPVHHFFVSDHTESFEKSTNFFFRNRIRLKEAAIWK